MDLRQFVSLALTLLAAGVMFLAYMRRRRRAKAESEKRIGEARRRRFMEVAQERRSGLPRRSRDHPQGGMGNMVVEAVDPLAQAEAYLTRGRDREAESVLIDAVTQDPTQYELKLKLLAIYHQRRDASAFEPLAEELYAALRGRGGELWNRLEAMGRCLNPHNRVPRADSWSVGTASTEPLQETAFQDKGRQQRQADLTALARAEAYLDMNDTQRALSLLNETLADQSDHAASVERRKGPRRAMSNHRGRTSQHPNDRRQTAGRRRQDRLRNV